MFTPSDPPVRFIFSLAAKGIRWAARRPLWAAACLLCLAQPLLGLICLVVLTFYHFRWDRTRAGSNPAERQVARVLDGLAEQHGSVYRVFHNVLLQDETHSTEIDHVVVSPYGVFVIETKGYRRVHVTDHGKWFSGTGEAAQREIRDPHLQNRGHIAALRAVLGDAPYLSLVVLAGTEVSGYLPMNTVKLRELRDAILAHQSKVLDRQHLEALSEALVQANADSSQARQEHVRRTKAKYSNSREGL